MGMSKKRQSKRQNVAVNNRQALTAILDAISALAEKLTGERICIYIGPTDHGSVSLKPDPGNVSWSIRDKDATPPEFSPTLPSKAGLPPDATCATP